MQTITFSSTSFDHQLEEAVGSRLRAKFPEVSFAHVQDIQGMGSEEAWAMWEHDESLDIRWSWGYFDKEAVQELTPFIKQGNLNLNGFAADLLQEVVDDAQKVWGLPVERGTPYVHALFYNREIFDLFGAPLPRHGMSWDEVIELARQVTGEKNGVHYSGLDIGDPSLLRSQLGFTFLDPDTDEPRLREEACQQYFRIIREAYSIPGNMQETKERLFVYGRGFRRQGNIAMCIHSPQAIASRHSLPFTVGAVSFPSTVSGTAVVPSAGGSVNLYLHRKSKSPALAFDVMSYLVSEPFQMQWARSGGFPARTGRRYEEEFGQDSPTFFGQSMSWLFTAERKGDRERISPFEWQAASIVKQEMVRAVRKEIDWQTAVHIMEATIREIVKTRQIK